MILVISLVCMILLGGLEFYLAGRKSKWPGLVLPVLAAVLLLPLSISIVGVYFPVPVSDYSIGDETLEDANVYIGVIYDETDHMAAFSDLKVKSNSTGEVSWLPLEFDEKGELVGGAQAMKYAEAVERLAEDIPEAKGRSSSSPDQMRWQYVKHNKGGYRDAALVTILYSLSVITYFCVYGIMRKRVRKKKLHMLNNL